MSAKNAHFIGILTQEKSKLRLLAITIVYCLLSLNASAQRVTLSNNLIYDASLTPNLRVGLRLSEHWSVGLNGGYRPWPTDDHATKKWKHLLISPDVRYWTDSVDVHHFFGINLIYSHYNVANVKFPFGMWKAVRDNRLEGDLGAIGAYYGYSWPLGRYWNFEFHIGAALGYTRYNKFECGHCGTKLGRESKLFVLPQAGLSLVLNIPPRPKKEPVVQPQQVVAPVVPTAAVMEKPPFVPVVVPVPVNTGRAGVLQEENPVLAHISQYKPYDRTRILRKEKDALYVHFVVAKSIIDNSFRNNTVTLDRIIDITRQIMADSTSSVRKIQIVGLASVEGGMASNEKLATDRALALQHYIQQRIDVPDSLFDTVGGGEAWAEFRDQLNDVIAGTWAPQGDPKPSAATIAGLQQALDIMDSESDMNRREQQLRRLNGGRTWQYLRQHILSDQRNSGYIRIYFDYVPDAAAATINQASELLKKEQYAEALKMLNTVRSDKRALNALGVALWQTGQQADALRCFREAAENGDETARENLKQMTK